MSTNVVNLAEHRINVRLREIIPRMFRTDPVRTEELLAKLDESEKQLLLSDPVQVLELDEYPSHPAKGLTFPTGESS